MIDCLTCDEFIVSKIVEAGTHDAFGIPGGVILRFLYALENNPNMEAHLTYHEQTAAFAALGYAQASGKLGVAYATRGPGICNMFTAIAEAYQESIPVLFITAHGNREEIDGVRYVANQEINIVAAVRDITKYAVNVDKIEQVEHVVKQAIGIALSGRRGPVLLDIFSGLWDKEIQDSDENNNVAERTDVMDIGAIIKNINAAKRPVLLIGDGMRYGVEKKRLLDAAERIKLPILSSRGSQDLLSGSPYYFGYIGSHGVRYSNFILSKADLIVVFGNRMAFPLNSKSFRPIFDKKIIRIDIDRGEFQRSIPNEEIFCADAGKAFVGLQGIEGKSEWLEVCNRIKNELIMEDCSEPVQKIIEFIGHRSNHTTYVCDVGNNEFWFARAYEKSGCTGKVLVSKAFGTLGLAIGKAIGAYFSTGEPVVCVAGDQGFQFNIQELQFISKHDLPIHFLVLNNHCSRMIADREESTFEGKYVHVNSETGYSVPDFKAIVKAYGVQAKFTEVIVGEEINLMPSLPQGSPLQDMEPAFERERYEMLNCL